MVLPHINSLPAIICKQPLVFATTSAYRRAQLCDSGIYPSDRKERSHQIKSIVDTSDFVTPGFIPVAES